MPTRGRPAYKITESDFSAAVRYIERARERGEVSTSDGYGKWLRASTAELLQEWCDEYLPKPVWNRMVNAMRQERFRNNPHRPRRHIDLTQSAWLRLTTLVEEELGGVSLSDAILRLEEVYYLAKDAGLLKTNPPATRPR